ncbi:MAG: AFG1 family ATPase [Burkholderiales bacterium]|jgi:cell division protein ZapE|nr:AFG1 family ATPase [Burkholderiales bacterium]MCA3161385.1 AFG1 family ATPase [Burkholderiales bacterium]MCA3163457.1 AFG1 family ATPase [Burkholderiales bacterium]MCA3165197.1 AFG1 family ATPase [Burkholderiales bacterium]MCA3170347.1 AFG1 family ATPase [Burkholderiales bacterium]
MPHDVVSFYEDALQRRGFHADAAQWRAVDRLQQAFEDWTAYRQRRTGTLTRYLPRPELPRALYLWGGVGRGKSFLMDAFFSVVPVQKKVRLHFHEFMRDVHRRLDELKGMADPLDELALQLSKKYRLICFDEFHVSDIADAMVLYRLLDQLFKNSVSFVMTSNYEPGTLYPDGLHRDRILPAIDLIYEKFDVLNVDSGIDYRQRALEQVQAYHFPLGADTDTAMRMAFTRIAETADENPTLHIEHRELRALRRAGGVVWFDFHALCAGPRSQNDYLEIAAQFHTVLLSGVPQMTPAMHSEARRFTWLVDVLYDHRVKLIMSAETSPERLYTEGRMANEFQRTVSRLIEMQSREYMEQPKRQAL